MATVHMPASVAHQRTVALHIVHSQWKGSLEPDGAPQRKGSLEPNGAPQARAPL